MADVTVTLEEQLACVEREIGLRLRVYPKWVASAKMRQATADKETERMRAVLVTLKAAASDPSSAAALIAQYRAALVQCVSVAKAWHRDDAFDIYFNHSPEMKLIRDVLGPMPEPE